MAVAMGAIAELLHGLVLEKFEITDRTGVADRHWTTHPQQG
jgi:hypothetical protein